MTPGHRLRTVLLAAAGAAALAAGNARPATLFALTDTGELFVSADGGVSWPARAALPVSDAAGLAAGSTPQELFLAAASGTVYRSTDAGVSWSAAGVVPASDLVDVAGRGTALLALSRTGTVWVSEDSGASFTAAGTPGGSDLVSLQTGRGGLLLAASRSGIVWVSSDGGAGWLVAGVVPASDVAALRARGEEFYLMTETGLTWRSADAGASWAAVGTASQLTVAGLTAAGEDLVAATREGLVARTADGADWTWVGAVNQLHVIALANDEPQVVGIPETLGEPSPVVVARLWPNPLRAGSGPVRVEALLSEPSDVRLEVYDVLGRLVHSAAQGAGAPGAVVLAWRPEHCAAGAYRLRVVTGAGAAASASLTLLR